MENLKTPAEIAEQKRIIKEQYDKIVLAEKEAKAKIKNESQAFLKEADSIFENLKKRYDFETIQRMGSRIMREAYLAKKEPNTQIKKK